ncbi:hypothetical protein [Marinobacter sp. SS5-14b]|uniref:hypothetical protein n=1 Tax=Marinobacter sp. SS5-14b TaxID=3050456 RepID=UPI0026E0F417|nr:hypothetical protein [Marinobacter sp. SS5-14b]
MIFSDASKTLLTSMCIDPFSYSKKLVIEFNEEAIIFNTVLEEFNSVEKIGDHTTFSYFWNKQSTKSTESKIFNWAYELYNNLMRFFSGGVLELYTFKQAEWGAPEVKITKDHVPPSNIDLLEEKHVIYRGMSREEHASKDYRQSWTIDLATAIRFARDTYSDEPSGIVVTAVIDRDDVVYYDKNNNEHEVIVKSGSIIDAREIKA